MVFSNVDRSFYGPWMHFFKLFDERNEAVKTDIVEVIEQAHNEGCNVGMRG